MYPLGHFISNAWQRIARWKPHLRRTLVLIPFLLGVGFTVNSEDLRTPMFTAATAIGAWYPRAFCLWNCQQRTAGRDQIAVVMFDQKFFHNRPHTDGTASAATYQIPPGREFVVTPDDYATLLRKLVKANVKAIVFDIIIDTKRHSDDEVQAIAATIQAVKKDVPIIVAQSHDSSGISSANYTCNDTPLPGRQPPVVTCAASVAAPVDWMPPFEDWTDKVHFAALYYPHYVERTQPGAAFGCKEPGQPTTVLDPTPAWAAYLVLKDDVGFCPEANDAVLDHDLFLAWGRGEAVCGADQDKAVNTDFWWHVWRTLTAVTGFFNRETSCSYLPRFSAADLGTNDDQMRGRVVFVGIDDTTPDDVIDVPQGGQLPGIFQHATALDNLLTAGRQGVLDLHPSSFQLPILGWSGDTIFMLVAVLLIALAKLLRERWASHFGLLRRFTLYLGLQAAIVIVLAEVVAGLFDVASARMVVVLVSLLLVEPISKGFASFTK